MRKIISVALLAMAVSAPAFAADSDQSVRREEARKEMRALQDKHLQERRALEDEMRGKMKTMSERQRKENQDLRAKYGMGKGMGPGSSMRQGSGMGPGNCVGGGNCMGNGSSNAPR